MKTEYQKVAEAVNARLETHKVFARRVFRHPYTGEQIDKPIELKSLEVIETLRGGVYFLATTIGDKKMCLVGDETIYSPTGILSDILVLWVGEKTNGI
jgi:hypothetical protein